MIYIFPSWFLLFYHFKFEISRILIYYHSLTQYGIKSVYIGETTAVRNLSITVRASRRQLVSSILFEVDGVYESRVRINSTLRAAPTIEFRSVRGPRFRIKLEFPSTERAIVSTSPTDAVEYTSVPKSCGRPTREAFVKLDWRQFEFDDGRARLEGVKR